MSGSDWNKVGSRLAELRKQSGLSQRRVAEMAGLTHSAVSSVEQNKVSPSVSTLHKLLGVYGLSLADFFAEQQPTCPNSILIEPSHRIQMGTKGVSLELVHSQRQGTKLGMLIESYEAGSSTGERLTHQGEEIGTVLEGAIDIEYGGETFRIKAGQSYAIDNNVPHVFTNAGTTRCRIISAHTPLTL